MSLLAVRSPFGAFNPKVWIEEGRLCARTNLFFQFLLLFFFGRTVIVDPKARKLFIRTRYLWLLERTVDYDLGEVDHIDYRFSSNTLGWNMQGRDTDTWEAYKVSVSLRDGNEIELFAFRGMASA